MPDPAELTETAMRHLALIWSLAAAIALPGCAAMWAGAGAGAAATGYEAQNKHDLDKLDRSYKDGHISKDEYLRRRDDIEDRSIVY
jgi:hypothetical protein